MVSLHWSGPRRFLFPCEHICTLPLFSHTWRSKGGRILLSVPLHQDDWQLPQIQDVQIGLPVICLNLFSSLPYMCEPQGPREHLSLLCSLLLCTYLQGLSLPSPPAALPGPILPHLPVTLLTGPSNSHLPSLWPFCSKAATVVFKICKLCQPFP